MYCELNGVKVNYEVVGNDKPLIILHGNSSSSKDNKAIVNCFKAKQQIYSLDSRVHGKTTRVKELTYEMLADDVIAFIKQQNLVKPTIIGVSDGGIVGLLVASKRPELLGGLIACSANLDNDSLKISYAIAIKLIYQLTRSVTFGLMVKPFYISVEDLAKISVPTLIVAGEKDLMPNAHTEKIARSINTSELAILENEKHYTFLTSKKLSKNNIISEFITKYNL